MTITIDSAWMDGPQVSQSVQGKDLLSRKTKKVSRGKFIMSHHVYITWLLLATSPDPPRVSSQDKQTLFVSLTVLLMDLLMNGTRTQGWMHMVNCLHNLFLLPLENKWHSVRWRHTPSTISTRTATAPFQVVWTPPLSTELPRGIPITNTALAFVVPNRYCKQNGQLKRATNKNQ